MTVAISPTFVIVCLFNFSALTFKNILSFMHMVTHTGLKWKAKDLLPYFHWSLFQVPFLTTHLLFFVFSFSSSDHYNSKYFLIHLLLVCLFFYFLLWKLSNMYESRVVQSTPMYPSLATSYDHLGSCFLIYQLEIFCVNFPIAMWEFTTFILSLPNSL